MQKTILGYILRTGNILNVYFPKCLKTWENAQDMYKINLNVATQVYSQIFKSQVTDCLWNI